EGGGGGGVGVGVAGGGAGGAAATKTRKILRIDRPRGLPTTATSGYVLWDELSRSAGPLAAGEGGNDEDRANRRDPAQARPRASRRHIPRPHHGGRRARRAGQVQT